MEREATVIGGEGFSRLIKVSLDHPALKETRISFLQLEVLRALSREGYRPLFLREVSRAVKHDVRRVFDSIKKLVKRGLVEKVARGLYKVTALGLAVFERARRALKESKGTGLRGLGAGGREVGLGSSGLSGSSSSSGSRAGARELLRARVEVFLDNVRGYLRSRASKSRAYVGGDPLGRLPPSRLSLFDEVRYFEVGASIDSYVRSFVALYYDERGGRTVLEVRPKRGDPRVKRRDYLSILAEGLVDAFVHSAVALAKLFPLHFLSCLNWLKETFHPLVK
ncbi:MAG: hypothetical protein QXM08_00535 [Thermofilaceae archaeon]